MQTTKHPVNSGDSYVDHSISCPNFDPGGGVTGSITTESGAADSGKVTVITIGISDEEGIAHWRSLPPSDLIFDERFTWHAEYGNPPVNEDGCDRKLNIVQLRRERIGSAGTKHGDRGFVPFL